MTPTAEERREIEHFPEALRVLLAVELAAGNAIAEIGHSFPAPPAGAYAKLARPVSTRPRESAGPLRYRGRDSSLYSGEWTDEKGFFFVLEPPGPPPDMPDMDAIRARRPDPLEALVMRPAGAMMERILDAAAPASPWMPEPFTVDIDIRGEMLTYREGDRMATVICTFGGDPCIVPRTLDGWWYPAAKRSVPLRDDERQPLINRIADYCRRRHGMTRLTFED